MQTDPPSNKKLSKGQLAHSTTQSAQPTAEGPTLPPAPPAHESREALGSARQPAVQKRHAGMPSTPAVPSAKPTAPGKRLSDAGTGGALPLTPTKLKVRADAATIAPPVHPAHPATPAAKPAADKGREVSPQRAAQHATGSVTIEVRPNVASRLRQREAAARKLAEKLEEEKLAAQTARLRVSKSGRPRDAAPARRPIRMSDAGTTKAPAEPSTAEPSAVPVVAAPAYSPAVALQSLTSKFKSLKGTIKVHIYRSSNDNIIFSFAEALLPLVPSRSRTPGVRLLQDLVEVWVAMKGCEYAPLLDTLSAEAIEMIDLFATPSRYVTGEYHGCDDEEEGLAFREMVVITEGDA